MHGIINLCTQLVARIQILSSCTETKYRSVYPVILLFFLSGLALLFTGHWHFGRADLLLPVALIIVSMAGRAEDYVACDTVAFSLATFTASERQKSIAWQEDRIS